MTVTDDTSAALPNAALPDAALPDATLQALVTESEDAEAAGRLDEAVMSLLIAIEGLRARGTLSFHLLERLADLQTELGEHDDARLTIAAARALAAAADHRPGVLRADLLRARGELATGRLDDAAATFAALTGDGGPLGPVSPDRRGAIITWLDELHFAGATPNLAAIRVSVVVALAELWAERGWYRSAAALLDAVRRDLPKADHLFDAGQVELQTVEYLLAAGELADARHRLDTLAPAAEAIAGLRIAGVGVRLALVEGRLGDAAAALPALAAAPSTDPQLLAATTAIRIAVLAELNLLERADDAAARAIAAIGPSPDRAGFVALLQRARDDVRARARSAFALWERPSLPRGYRLPDAAPDRHAAPATRLTAAWTGAANDVIARLERDDDAAAAAQARLEEVTRGVESTYVAARVEFSRALLAYQRTSAPHAAELLSVADRFRAMGARLAEWQAVRHAAWACARLARVDDQIMLTRRAEAILAAIEAGLAPADRPLFRMNKWSARDELVSARMREVGSDRSGRPRTPRRREVCRVFREIDQLTHWPLDEVLGDAGQALAGDESPDLVLEWVRHRLARPPARRDRRDFVLRSTWSLWRFPRRTAALHYHVLPDRTYLFRVWRRHLDVRVLPVGRVHLPRDLVRIGDDHDALEQLACDIGITDALADAPPIDRLAVIAHDALTNVPFAALRVGGQPLCARVAIAQLDRLDRLRRPGAHVPPRRVVGVGLTDYGGSGHVDLPGTEVEARAVGEAGGTEAPMLIVGADATCARVRAALSTAAHIHVAAHGVFRADQPARTGIVLRDDVDPSRFRTLALRDLRGLDASQLQLVTLATCHSGLTDNLPGRERLGLPTALLDARALGVIASLWPIEDAPAVAIMTDLYRRLRTQRAMTALASLQAELARAGRPAAHWAGLVFYGND